MKAIVSQIIITGFSSRVDGSLSFRAATPELSVTERVDFMELQGKNCRALFEPTDYAADGKTEIKNPLGTKTPSQRLRGVLFVLYTQLTKKVGGLTDKSFDQFYVEQYESIIESYKRQLEPET